MDCISNYAQSLYGEFVLWFFALHGPLIGINPLSLCLLKIAEPVRECIFEWIKHRIVIVSASEYTLSCYLNVFSVIPRDKRHFYPANWFWENSKSLFIAEPRSDFKRCYEQWILENHNWIIFIAASLWFWNIAKYKRPISKGFNSLHYWAGLNVLKIDCFWSYAPWMQATCLFCVPMIFVAYLDIITV